MQKISKSVFVTNFPEESTARDLWKVCNAYGTVVDVFIPFKRSKEGKRFAFVRFIKVINLERLVVNLCTIWIGRYHLHANYARFERPQKPNSFMPRGPNNSIPKGTNMENSKSSFVSVLKHGNQSPVTPENSKPTFVLDESCIKEYDFGMSLMGKAKDVSAIPNLPCILSKEGFQNVKLSYLGGMNSSFGMNERIVWVSIEGLPIKAWTPNTFRKIASLWGEFVEWEDSDSKSFSCKQLCLKTKMDVIINERQKIIVQGKVHLIRVKELNAWSPNFQDDDQDDLSSDEESQEDDVSNKDDKTESDVDIVSESSFMHENDFVHKVVTCSKTGEVGTHSEYPFNIYGLLDGQKNKACNSGLGNKVKRSWIKELCQKHRINFVSIQETKAENIDLRTIKDLWGNQMFDHVVGPSVGCSGGGMVISCDIGDFNEKSLNIVEPNGLIRLKKKLQALKIAIKAWSKEAKKRSNDRKINLQHNLSEVDKIIDQGKSNDEILNKRITLLNELQELNSLNAIEISQKAKVRWSIEGDENSKYFHGILNKKRSQLAIRGTLVNGEWISEPHRVKNEFFSHFKKQFSPPQTPRIRFDFTFPTRLSSDQVEDLEHIVTYDEVKRAVWDCGTNKSPRPDGFSFEFYHKYWTTIDEDVFQAVRDFFVNGHFPRGCNSSFIALIPKIQDAKILKVFRLISLIGSVYKIIAKILANRLCLVLPYLISDVQSAFVLNRQILDGPFILNELLSWCKFKKSKGMIFKVDFEKAFDSVKWDYLDETLKAFGFGSKWCKWISSCLNNAMGSVLVNGSPTLEFQFHKGLKQGGRLTLLKSVLTSIPLYHMSIFKVPKGVLNILESIRRNFFYGFDGSDRKLAWIG
ncbi:RNA-directed DNA polymerase, eukaryota [Tanacetum coccineum]